MAGVTEEPEDRRFPLAAVPAVVALAACAILTAVVLLKSETPETAAIQTRADAALAAGDVATAHLDYQHLLALQPNQPRHAYDLARTLDAMKRRREAASVLNTVAPASGGGYPPGQLLLAEWAVEARVLGGMNDPALLRDVPARLDAAAADPSLRSRVATLREVMSKLPAGPGDPTTRPT